MAKGFQMDFCGQHGLSGADIREPDKRSNIPIYQKFRDMVEKCKARAFAWFI